MSVEVIVLALASALRPTALAAVYALLSAPGPRRLLTAFVLAGFAFSAWVGILIVEVLDGADLRHGPSTFDALVELVAGVAALGFAAGLAQGRVQRRSREQPAERQSRLLSRLRAPSVGAAAAAGVATHLPGLFYLVSLNAISAQDPGAVGGAVDVLVFNAVWWSIPVASLVFFLMRPADTRNTLAAVNGWARARQRGILTALFGLVGLYLAVEGAVNLFG